MVHLDYRDARPIYSQIIDGFREQIAAGILKPGDKLPSVRDLASELAINPNTIQRAYSELEAEGFIYSVPGKGSFAAAVTEPLSLRREELNGRLKEIITELRYLNVTQDEVIALVKEGFDT